VLAPRSELMPSPALQRSLIGCSRLRQQMSQGASIAHGPIGRPLGLRTPSAFNRAQKRWSSALCCAICGPVPFPEFIPPAAFVPEPLYPLSGS